MKTSTLLTVLALAAPAFGASAAGEEAPEPGAGLLGNAAPEISLPTSGGETLTLSETTPEKNVVLVFFRGVW